MEPQPEQKRKGSDKVGNDKITDMEKRTHPAPAYCKRIRMAWTILFPLLVSLSSCMKDPVDSTMAEGRSELAEFSLTAIGPHQLMLSPRANATDSIIILDWVDLPRPSVNIPKAIEHYQMENNGQDVLLIGDGKPLARFSTRNDPQSALGEAVYHVNGISKLTDRGGFNASALTTISATDAFDAANSVRESSVNGSEKIGGGGGGKTHPEALCYSGGPGATSCSTHGNNGYGCTVTCGSGYYACCDMDGLECKCVKE